MFKYLNILILFFSIFHSSNLFAENIFDKIKQANDLYRNGEFDRSIEIYDSLIDNGISGASIHYNLGNAYYRIGEIGYAILNYEKALKYSPSDEDIKHNLAFANLSTVDRIQPLPEFFLFEIWESVLAFFTVNGWTYLTYSIFLLLLILIGFYFFARSISQQKLSLISSLVIFLLFLFSVSLLIVKINREATHINGIVIEQAVTVKTSPDPKSTDAFVIHEGLKIKLEDKLDDWIKIRLADGKVGWIENDVVEEI